MDCYCDYDAPEFCTQTYPKARKKYRCYECAGHILPGEKYEYTAGKWDGDFVDFRTCERCHDLRKWVQNNVPCFCWEYGNVDEGCKYAVEDAVMRAPKETVGLRFGLLRRMAARDNFNKSRRLALTEATKHEG